mgnify:CR=1 FL=1
MAIFAGITSYTSQCIERRIYDNVKRDFTRVKSFLEEVKDVLKL